MASERLLDKLPDELLERIFLFLKLKDLLIALRVEKRWNRLLKRNRHFFKNKFGRSKLQTKRFISNIQNDETKAAYLNKETFQILPENLNSRNDMIGQGLMLSETSSHMSYEIEQLLLTQQGKAALIEGWIKPRHAIKFTPKTLSILLFKVYPISKNEITPKHLFDIIKRSEYKRGDTDIINIETILDFISDEKNSRKISYLGWNKKELINLFYLKIKTLKGVFQYDVREIKEFFPLTELAKIKESTAHTLFTEKGMAGLKDQHYSLTQILYGQERDEFSNNFNLIVNNDVGLSILKNKKLSFEHLVNGDTKVLTKLLCDKTCYLALNLNLIPVTFGIYKFSETELDKYCENVLSGLAEGLFQFDEIRKLLINKPQVFVDFILSKDGLFLLRKKQFSLETLNSYLNYDYNYNNCNENRTFTNAVQNSFGSSHKIIQKLSPIFTLLDITQLNTLKAVHFKLLSQEDVIAFLERLKPQERELLNIKNLIKVLLHCKGLYALKNHIITFLDLQSEDFDGDVDLSISMYNAINESIIAQVAPDDNEELIDLEDDENSVEETEDLDQINDSDDKTTKNSLSDNDFNEITFSKCGNKTS